jgi:hypothetical protein
MPGREKAAIALRDIGRIVLRLLIFGVLYAAMASAVFAIGFGAARWLRPDQFWETVIAVSTFGLCLPALWLALRWSSAMAPHMPVSKPAEPRCSVQVTEEAIISSGENRPTEQVFWRDLTEVAIINEDAFPIGFQYWLLVGTGGTGAVVPSEAEGAGAMLEAMQARLPGFDNEAVIAAMGSIDGAFRVWKTPG